MKTPFGDWIYPPTQEEIQAVLEGYRRALQRKREMKQAETQTNPDKR